MANRNSRLIKGVLAGAAAVVAAILLGLGTLYVMMSRLPSQQAELQDWVAAELGLSFSFDRLDSRFGANGPEITFYEASVAAADQAVPFLYAREAAVSLDPWKLLLEREPTVSALVIDGTRVAVTRTAAGEFRFEGGPEGSSDGTDLTSAIPLEVELRVRDSQVQYFDEVSEESWQFDEVAVSLTRERDRIAVEIGARPPEGLAQRIDLALDGDMVEPDAQPGRWQLYGNLLEVELAALMRLVPGIANFRASGNGNVEARIDWSEGRIVSGTATAALDNVALPGASVEASYERLALQLDWNQVADRSWQFIASDIELNRNQRGWPGGGRVTLQLNNGIDGIAQLALRGDFLRLDDITPIVSSLPRSEPVAQWLAFAPRGDLRDVELVLRKRADAWEYSVASGYAGFGFEPVGQWPGLSGLSGEVRADERSGRVEFLSGEVRLDWPRHLSEALDMDELRGLVVWREGQNVVRIVSDDLLLRAGDTAARSNLELTLPLDGSSPRLDFASRMSAMDVTEVKRYLPVGIMPQSLYDWLNRAMLSGQLRDIQADFFGALDAFPFTEGGGQLRVTADVRGGELAYVRGWPVASELEGELEFLNASLRGSGSGRLLDNVSDNVEIGIADLRTPVFTLKADTTGPLADVLTVLNTSPQISRNLGPDFARLQAPGGTGDISLDLSLPLRDRASFELIGRLDILDGELAFEGLRARATEVRGVIDVNRTTVTGDGIEAIFLNGPATVRVVEPDEPGYRVAIEVEGESTTAAVAAAFDMPLQEHLAGQALWQARLLIPELQQDAGRPVRLAVDSNLVGASLRFPEPFAKQAAEPEDLGLVFEFPGGDRLRVNGNLGASRRFAFSYLDGPDGYRLTRGAVRFGGELPVLPSGDGLTVHGSLPELDVSAWLALTETFDTEPAEALFTSGELELAELFAFGQELGSSTLSASRDGESWQVGIDSEAIAGSLFIPRDLSSRPQIVAEMQRLYLSSGNPGQLEAVDPRQLPGLSLAAEEFAFGTRRLGRVSAEIVPDVLGLRLVSFESSSDSLMAGGTASWLVGAGEARTEAVVSMNSNDVAGALEALDFTPMIEGDFAEVVASVNWSGPPTSNWMNHVNGDVSVRVDDGSMLDIEPGGAGRVAGLMSFVALPRRLALDFRDVFTRGFAFDEITGNFLIADGQAYTNDLKLTGPGAEIGVVGRTGLRDRDYEQQAVVTAEPGKILPTVGALLSGPGAAAALLIFTQIFKEPLRGIGQASYCITGSWEEPSVERLSPEQIREGSLCAALPPEGAAAFFADAP